MRFVASEGAELSRKATQPIDLSQQILDADPRKAGFNQSP
jgi:hypothetical protein